MNQANRNRLAQAASVQANEFSVIYSLHGSGASVAVT